MLINKERSLDARVNFTEWEEGKWDVPKFVSRAVSSIIIASVKMIHKRTLIDG